LPKNAFINRKYAPFYPKKAVFAAYLMPFISPSLHCIRNNYCEESILKLAMTDGLAKVIIKQMCHALSGGVLTETG